MILLLQYTIIFASVLTLVALGGCFSEHSGVINLGLEGIMVMGALGGALAMNMFSSIENPFLMIGIVCITAIIFGMLYSCLLAIASVNFNADQTLVGTAMNLLSTSVAAVIVRTYNSSKNVDDVSTILKYVSQKKLFIFRIGGFEFNWMMLIALILLVVMYIVLYKTKFGLRLRACGENPQAANSVGIDVYRMRWAGVLISGFLGGLGGITYIMSGVSEWKF